MEYWLTSVTPFALNSLEQLEPFLDACFAVFRQSYTLVHEAKFSAHCMDIIPNSMGNRDLISLAPY
jgi:transcriptional regulatory protein GAL4